MGITLEFRQFASTVKKNAIEKRKNPVVCLCESCSHLVIFVVLLLGYGLSVVIYYQPESYVKLDVQIPPDFLR
jgi:hypothetical protein